MHAVSALLALLLVPLVSADPGSITAIQGPGWRSPLVGAKIQNITGIVTAKSKKSGFWITGERDPASASTSYGVQVYTSSAAVQAKVEVGDLIRFSGRVTEYVPTANPEYLSTTEIQDPNDFVIVSRNNSVAPVVIGKDRIPPTQALSALDAGPDGWLSVPNNKSLIDIVNAQTQPDKYGLDFWSSLEGQLVTIPEPVALNFENSHGEFWVHGDWPVTGKNEHGGLTITFGPGGIPDANPEAVIIGNPLDGSKNPKTAMGMTLTDITGVVAYQFGYYYVLPLSAPTVVTKPDSKVSPTYIKRSKANCQIVVGDYNIENLSTGSKHVPTIANHIATYLRSPDLMFLQEVQDDNGVTDDGTVSANQTLATLRDAITKVDASTKYDFVNVVPIDKQDGGQPGGNIRPAYLWRSDKFKLAVPARAGGPKDSVKVMRGPGNQVVFSPNPGRVNATSSAWLDSRKPLAAAWQTPDGRRFYTINVHLTSKSGSLSTQSNGRPYVNRGVEQRTQQIQVIADFVKSILKIDPWASIIIAGDHNEYIQTRSVFKPFENLMYSLDEVAEIPPEERYTYTFDQNTQQLDHIWVSRAIASRGVDLEHVHINTWAPEYKQRTSDHDPSVAKLNIC